MNKIELIEAIADKNFDVDKFVELVLSDEEIKALVLENLLNNRNIMVYYHCYYIISKASEVQPELFYSYWNEIASLLNHRNSYHRDIGLTIIANLAKVDYENHFADLYEKYILHFIKTLRTRL